MGRLRGHWQRWMQGWLQRRMPTSAEVRLGHRQIFILPTRAGLGLLGLLAALLIAAINYQNSLVYALTFLLFSLFWVTLHHSWRNLAGMQLRAGAAAPVFCGEQAALCLWLDAGQRARSSLQLGWNPQQPVVLDVADGEPQVATLYLKTSRRGWLQPDRLRIETRWPLGWFVAWSLPALQWRVLVYPQPVPFPLPVRATGNDSEEGEPVGVDGVEDFAGLRAYQPGDSKRRLDWRAWSRGQGLHSRIFSDLAADTCWLTLDLAQGADLETRLGCLTGWILRLEHEGRPYGLLLPGERIEPGLGEAQREQCLRALALFGSGS